MAIIKALTGIGIDPSSKIAAENVYIYGLPRTFLLFLVSHSHILHAHAEPSGISVVIGQVDGNRHYKHKNPVHPSEKSIHTPRSLWIFRWVERSEQFYYEVG